MVTFHQCFEDLVMFERQTETPANSDLTHGRDLGPNEPDIRMTSKEFQLPFQPERQRDIVSIHPSGKLRVAVLQSAVGCRRGSLVFLMDDVNPRVV